MVLNFAAWSTGTETSPGFSLCPLWSSVSSVFPALTNAQHSEVAK